MFGSGKNIIIVGDNHARKEALIKATVGHIPQGLIFAGTYNHTYEDWIAKDVRLCRTFSINILLDTIKVLKANTKTGSPAQPYYIVLDNVLNSYYVSHEDIKYALDVSRRIKVTFIITTYKVSPSTPRWYRSVMDYLVFCIDKLGTYQYHGTYDAYMLDRTIKLYEYRHWIEKNTGATRLAIVKFDHIFGAVQYMDFIVPRMF